MTVLADREVTPRKRHQCVLCDLDIPIGMRCRYQAGLDGRDFLSVYAHLGCSSRALYEWSGLEDEWGLDPDDMVPAIQAWCGPWIDSQGVVSG